MAGILYFLLVCMLVYLTIRIVGRLLILLAPYFLKKMMKRTGGFAQEEPERPEGDVSIQFKTKSKEDRKSVV